MEGQGRELDSAARSAASSIPGVETARGAGGRLTSSAAPARGSRLGLSRGFVSALAVVDSHGNAEGGRGRAHRGVVRRRQVRQRPRRAALGTSPPPRSSLAPRGAAAMAAGQALRPPLFPPRHAPAAWAKPTTILVVPCRIRRATFPAPSVAQVLRHRSCATAHHRRATACRLQLTPSSMGTSTYHPSCHLLQPTLSYQPYMLPQRAPSREQSCQPGYCSHEQCPPSVRQKVSKGINSPAQGRGDCMQDKPTNQTRTYPSQTQQRRQPNKQVLTC